MRDVAGGFLLMNVPDIMEMRLAAAKGVGFMDDASTLVGIASFVGAIGGSIGTLWFTGRLAREERKEERRRERIKYLERQLDRLIKLRREAADQAVRSLATSEAYAILFTSEIKEVREMILSASRLQREEAPLGKLILSSRHPRSSSRLPALGLRYSEVLLSLVHSPNART